MNGTFLAPLLGGLICACLLPAPAMAQSAFDGTWKIDLNKVHMPKKPDVLLLRNGMYQCQTCVPPVSVKADGEAHPVSGHPYYDSMTVKVVDDHTIQQTEEKNGKVVASSETVVSPDGKTASFEFNDSSNSNGAPVTGKGSMARVAKGPTGAHAISGSWRTTSYGAVSDNGLIFTYKVAGDSISMSTPTGQSYDARLGGADAPYMGDPGTTSISVRKLGKRVMQETAKRDGKVISVSRMTVAPDGRTMNIAVDGKMHGTTMSFVATRE